MQCKWISSPCGCVCRCLCLTCMSRKRARPRRAVTLNRRKQSCARRVPDISVQSVRVDLSKKRKVPRAPTPTAPFIPPQHQWRKGGCLCRSMDRERETCVIVTMERERECRGMTDETPVRTCTPMRFIAFQCESHRKRKTAFVWKDLGSFAAVGK